MTPTAQIVRARIEAEGPLTVADYMRLRLCAPDGGYYRRSQPLGAEGDFVTAPEISQIFGELIGAWAAHMWAEMGRPSPFRLVELGPGRGVLMADALRAARNAPGFLDAMRLSLVEISAPLRLAQGQALASFHPEWAEDFAAFADLPAIVLANEFLDALPVRQRVFRAGVWRERRVALAQDRFGFIEAERTEAPFQLAVAPRDGDVAESCAAAEGLIGRFAGLARRHAFAALIVDYGHRGEAYGDTLQAVRGHRFADPLAMEDDPDLSAHVDFGALARAAERCGLAAHGPLGMGLFLMRLGAGARLESLLRNASPEQARLLISGLRRLTSPAEMGELFKAMAVTGGTLKPPPF